MNRSRMLFICLLEMMILIASPMLLASADGRILWASARVRIEIEKNEDPPVAKYRVEIIEDGYSDGNKVYSPTVGIVLANEYDTDIGLEIEDPEEDKGDLGDDREGQDINEQRD